MFQESGKKNIPQHFPFTSTSAVIPLLKILAATFPVRPAPMMPTLQRCKAPTGNDCGFMGFLNSGTSLVMLIPRPCSFTSPSCRSCRNPEVRSAQSYNALAKLGFWITKSSCWNRWSRREKHVTHTNPTPFWDALVMLGIPENARKMPVTSEVQKTLLWVTLKGHRWKDHDMSALQRRAGILFPHSMGFKQLTRHAL